VLPDGVIVVAVPQGANPDAVATAVYSRRLWLAKAVRRRAAIAAAHPAKEIVDGEGFEYLGRHYQLLLVDDQADQVKLRGCWLQLRRPDSDELGAASIIDWYHTRGQRWLGDRVRSWAGRVGIDIPAVEVGDLGTRWGVRRGDGSVAFHWAAAQLPPVLLDLVVVHELVHLIVPQHNDEFRRRVMLALPDAAGLEDELGEIGRRVWMGAIRGERIGRSKHAPPTVFTI
jgi:hypothetical protein